MLSHLSNEDLLASFEGLVAQERRTTAALLAHIAEIDARHLYLRLGHESMKSYCMKVLDLSEPTAASRVHVARLARDLPTLLDAIRDGRLRLSVIRILAGRLTRENVDEWIARASGKTVTDVESLLAASYPQAEPLRLDDGISPQRNGQDSNRVQTGEIEQPISDTPEPETPRVRTKIAPLSPQRYTLQVTLSKETHDKLRRVQQLLGHAVPDGDIATILERALDLLVRHEEKRRFGSPNARGETRTPRNRRAIPAHVRRAVYERDGGRCTALLADGTRCGSDSKIEFDHIRPVARGGASTVDNLRVVCAAHNQAAAEEEFGLDHVARRKGERRGFVH